MRAPILALKEVRLADGPMMLFDGVDLALDARNRAEAATIALRLGLDAAR